MERQATYCWSHQAFRWERVGPSGEGLSNMKLKGEASTHRRVIDSYFETTSSTSLQGEGAFERGTFGLRRGLGDWLDVRGKEVLDLGCGTGQVCWLTQQAGATRVVGVNLSAGELKYARGKTDAEFEQADILAYLEQAADESFDRIFAMNILEHLDAEVLAGVLQHAKRVLRPGGTLVAMVPNAISPFSGMTRYWDITHLRAFTPSSVRQLMRLAGFQHAEFREWGPRAHGLISGLRAFLWQGIRATISARLIIETGSAKGGVYTSDMLFRLQR